MHQVRFSTLQQYGRPTSVRVYAGQSPIYTVTEAKWERDYRERCDVGDRNRTRGKRSRDPRKDQETDCCLTAKVRSKSLVQGSTGAGHSVAPGRCNTMAGLDEHSLWCAFCGCLLLCLVNIHMIGYGPVPLRFV
ncbi:hypothetical protein N657DRAFT_211685 [Parathielavia appendiculata]|uniref:Uncharacterized protein n=1 Tax=Parathielavia appendiculata TaxID=2587402 RepID=A0AAN6U7J0_9PEZI|nr:hypothetical protein N657DRAFT_211685 [Parathielavia appendiculata]